VFSQALAQLSVDPLTTGEDLLFYVRQRWFVQHMHSLSATKGD